ncbi:MAG: outer membrane protein transport protein [Acidobacteriota bacterium]
MRRKATLLVFCGCLAALPVWAGNGPYLHGIGASNSSLGGVSTALATDVVGALTFNPALLTQFEGDQIYFGAEVFFDDPVATARFNNTPQPDGSVLNGSFTTESETEPGVLPAIGFSHRFKNRPATLGFGLLAVAGFRTDWPHDPNNPIFAPQPDGFGSIKTNLAITKIPIAYAWEVNDKLSLGVSLTVHRGGLAISPLPPGAPDCTLPAPGSGRSADCFYADADNVVSTHALALQVGLYYKTSPTWAFGFSYETPKDFDDYTWESVVALPFDRLPDGSVVPNSDDGNGTPAFGSRRVLTYPLDLPAIASFGIGYTPQDSKWKVGFDARWFGLASTDGAGGVGGFRPDRGLNEIGWDDIFVAAVGAVYQHSETTQWRFGFNYSETPIQSEVAFTSIGTPPTFKDHYTFGVGIALNDNITLDLSGYWAPERSVTGPLLTAFAVPSPQTLADQIVPNTEFTIEESIISALVGVSYKF